MLSLLPTAATIDGVDSTNYFLFRAGDEIDKRGYQVLFAGVLYGVLGPSTF